MNDISKLPKWARERINESERRCAEAVKNLHDWHDHQTPQPIRVEELSCHKDGGPECMTRYIEGHKVTIVWAGVELGILLRDDYIDLKYSDDKGYHKEVMLIPDSFQSFRLKSVPMIEAGRKQP